MKSPLVSIIIPVFNNLEGLKKSIESIQDQSFTDYEVWVIDGGSNSETSLYLKELKYPFQFISEEDSGIYDAMNKGILFTNGEWLYFLGSGDVFLNEDVLEITFKKPIQRKYQLLSGSILYQGENQPFIYSKSKKEKIPSWSFLMWLRNGLHHQGTFYREKLFKEYTYSLNYQILSDYWLNLLFFKKGFSCKILPYVVSVCDSNGISKQRQWRMYKEEIALKTSLSKKVFQPLFYTIAIIKYTISKLNQ